MNILSLSLKPEHLDFEKPRTVGDAVELVLAIVASDGGQSFVTLSRLDGGAGYGHAIRSDDAGLRVEQP